MTGARTGVGFVFGAAFGLIFGQTMFLFGHMLFDNLWVGPMIGAAAGLIIGAVADLLAAGGDHVDHDPSRSRDGSIAGREPNQSSPPRSTL